MIANTGNDTRINTTLRCVFCSVDYCRECWSSGLGSGQVSGGAPSSTAPIGGRGHGARQLILLVEIAPARQIPLPQVHVVEVIRVFRIMAIVMFALFAPQATGASIAFAASDPCSERCGADGCPEEKRCPGEKPDRGCPGNCQLCVCCGSLSRALAPRTVVVFPASCMWQVVGGRGDALPPSPEPAEILHVPKLALA